MRSVSARVLVLFGAFAIGIGSVAASSSLHLSPSALYRKVAQYVRPHRNFESVSIACGGGHHTYTYKTDDGQVVTESGTRFTASEEEEVYFQKAMALAERIVERDPDSVNAEGKAGERIVFETSPGEDGIGGVTILWHDGRENLQTVNAPDLKLALEFEQYWFDAFADSKL